MIRVMKVTEARTKRTIFLNPMHVVSISEAEEGSVTEVLISVGADEDVLQVVEAAPELAHKLEAGLRNLGHSPR